MNEIKLSIKDENLDTVLNILENLKAGLIVSIDTNGRKQNKRQNKSSYQPKTNTIIREEDSGTADTSGKYINPAAYKQRLKK